MTDFVYIDYKRNRGWPWPEESWGLSPMFGEHGWCRSCGVPNRPQEGPLILQTKGLKVEGAWVPNWQFNAICLEESVALNAVGRFTLDMIEVEWKSQSPGRALQIMASATSSSWYDPELLRIKAIEQHGTAGATCAECGVWRWMPLAFGTLPPLSVGSELDEFDIAVSPEWFGDGHNAYKELLMRRELADFLAAASPRDFKRP